MAQSARCLAAYAYAAAGPGESTTDLAWDGQTGVFEVGEMLAEGERFAAAPALTAVDVDLGRLRAERIRQGTFSDGAALGPHGLSYRTVEFTLDAPAGEIDLRRPLERFPYVPSDPQRLREDCMEAWAIQVQGLSERLRATGLTKLVIGVSGGLDSTEALVVAVKAMAALDLPPANVLAYTLPGFATSDATKANAWALMRGLGVTAAEIDITETARRMLADLGHPFARGEPIYDVTFENVQAGLRTDYLFRLANQNGALVVGTGDLSELGLGWCTYGVGDQMSPLQSQRRRFQDPDPAPDPLRRQRRRFRRGDEPDVARDPRHRDFAGACAGGPKRRRAAIDPGGGRPLRPAGLQPLLPDPLRLSPVQDRLSGVERLARRGDRRVAQRHPPRR